MNRVRLAIVTNSALGWKTVRKRWEADLAEFHPMLFHIEAYRRNLSLLSERYG